MFKVFKVQFGADEVKVDTFSIFSPCKITCNIGLIDRSQVPQHLIDDLVEPHILPKDIIDIRE
jgi:hypothetical protein